MAPLAGEVADGLQVSLTIRQGRPWARSPNFIRQKRRQCAALAHTQNKHPTRA